MPRRVYPFTIGRWGFAIASNDLGWFKFWIRFLGTDAHRFIKDVYQVWVMHTCHVGFVSVSATPSVSINFFHVRVQLTYSRAAGMGVWNFGCRSCVTENCTVSWGNDCVSYTGRGWVQFVVQGGLVWGRHIKLILRRCSGNGVTAGIFTRPWRWPGWSTCSWVWTECDWRGAPSFKAETLQQLVSEVADRIGWALE